MGKEESVRFKSRFNYKMLFIMACLGGFVAYSAIMLKPVDAFSEASSGDLIIPSIGLVSDVVTLRLNDGRLDTPDEIVGSFSNVSSKTLLIGHASTIFQDLHFVSEDATIIYNNKLYTVSSINTLLKSDIDMAKLLESAPRDTLVIMTCAGEFYDNGDSSHRLIVFAVAN